ncbi:MAG: ABC transporter permease [Chloroflexi bacterium]|nr:MAG: ABC transporter permease [Chloroflexota bacterium]MBL1193336.1 ABC transporter permease [Chloroflexota bacterium]NOH10628.1 FtsX-like permease family protein [Chloroflexota bacterium]
MRELPLALSYLKGRPGRSIMTILSIVIGVMIMFGLNGLAGPMQKLFITNAESVALANVDLYVSRSDGSFFREEFEDNVGAVEGVVSTASMIVRSVILPPEHYQTSDGTDVSTIQVYGIDTGSADEAFNIVTAGGRRLSEGRMLSAGDGQGVLISEQFAQGVGVGVGDMVELPGAGGWLPFEVIGILDEPGVLLGNQNVFMPTAAAQELLNTPTRINVIMARYAEGSDARAIDATIQSMFGRGFELAPLDGGQDVWAALMEFVNVVFTMFGLLALAMAGLIMFNTFRTSVVERQRDIGLLRAVGAKRRFVMRTVLLEGLILAGAGTVLGILFGIAFGYLARAGLSSLYESLLGFPLGPPEFDVFTFAVSIIFGMGVPLVSVLLPARGASLVTPLEAMRPTTVEQEKAIRRSRLIVGLICLVLGVVGLFSGIFPLMALGMMIFLLAMGLLGPLLISPVTAFFNRTLFLVFGQEGGIAAGNIARQPRRASITASSLMVSLAILIGLGGMLASTYGGSLRFLRASFRSDYLLMSSLLVTNDTLGAGPDFANSVLRVPGVSELTTLRQKDVTSEDGIGMRMLGIDSLNYARIGGLTFVEGDESAYEQVQTGNAVIVNGRYASQFEVGVGDTVSLEGDHGSVNVTVAAIGLDYINIKLPTVYLDQVVLTREFGVRNDQFLLVNTEPGADIVQLEEDLLAVTQAYPGFGVLSREKLYASQEQIADSATIGLNVMLGLLAAPALLGLANTMGINVLERTREIGMMRAVGAKRRQVQRMIVAESLLLSLMGIALGIVCGIFLSMLMTGVLEFSGLVIPYSFPAVGVLTAIAVGLIAGVVAAMLPARRASDLQIIAALAYE